MVFSIFFCLTIVLLIAFVVTKKNLHLFEILFMWMVIIVIHHNFLTVFSVNMGMYNISTNPPNYWALVFIRVTLIPLLIIWYFDLTSVPGPYKIWIWLPVGISILVGICYLEDALNIFKHTGWKLWWEFAEWFVIFLLVYFPWLWFRSQLRKELK